MSGHLRANLWLLVTSLVLCCVIYPGVLLAIGQFAFPHQANGCLVLDKDQKVIGSELIAQPFTDDAPEYFQPRPSAASYNGAASGASNWGANNPLLRDRVARQLGPVVCYLDGRRVGPEVQDWFRATPDRVAEWANRYPVLAAQWVKGDKINTAYVSRWAEEHAGAPEFVRWRQENASNTSPEPADLASPFFASFAREHAHSWFAQDDKGDDGKPLVGEDGKPTKRVKPVAIKPAAEEENSDVQAYFFDLWLQMHPHAELEPVPADMVMASGSGLDPIITLDNARYQFRHRIARAWVKKLAGDRADAGLEKRVTDAIEGLLMEKRAAPLGGLVGPDTVNVLEVNRALAERIGRLAP